MLHVLNVDGRRLHHLAQHYLIVGDALYHRGVDTVLRRCVTHEEAELIMNDCHFGACGGHLSGLAIAQKNIAHKVLLAIDL